jgi:hypothetical protein
VTTYSHLLTLAFTVETDDPDCDFVTRATIMKAIESRLDDLKCMRLDEFREAVLPPLESVPLEAVA